MVGEQGVRTTPRHQIVSSSQDRFHRPALLRQHRLCRPVRLLLRLAAPLAAARLPRPLRHARRAQGRGTGRHALSPRQQGEGRSLLPRRHDASHAPPGRAGAPGLPGHHLLRLQAGRERRRRRHRQHRLGDLPRRGDPRRLRRQRHLAHAHRAEQSHDRHPAPTPSPPASSSSAANAPADAPTATRREFVAALKAELPAALAHLQRGNIAPVDLAQAAIGPGMAVYTRYAKVLDAAGKPLSVREALALINQTLDEALAEQEGDFDADSRWALAWFEQVGLRRGRVRRGRDALQGQEHQRRGHGRGGHPGLGPRQGAAAAARGAAGRLGPGEGPAADGLGRRAPAHPRARSRGRRRGRGAGGQAGQPGRRRRASWPTGCIRSASGRSGRRRRCPTTGWCRAGRRSRGWRERE